MQAEKVSESVSEQCHIMHPEHLNGRGWLFGGKLVEWIDVVAGVVARRHCGTNVTTARIESVDFLAPALANEILTIRGKVTYVGRTSLEIKVETFRERVGETERELINVAYIIAVALDDKGKPSPVPPLVIETEEQAEEFERGKERAEQRKKIKVK